MELSAWKRTDDLLELIQFCPYKKNLNSVKGVTYSDKSNPLVAELCIEWILYGFDFNDLGLRFISDSWKI